MHDADVIIAGGGLAGLAAAIDLRKRGYSVLIIEKSAYPRHKVCGEYISGEVVPYLDSIGVYLSELDPEIITEVTITTAAGVKLTTALPLNGLGISRYMLDNHLAETAKKSGCGLIFDTITDIQFNNNSFVAIANGQRYTSKVVVGSYGKRSKLDTKLKRDFVAKKSNWLAAKAHYTGIVPAHVVGLHHFRGGYCGVSRVEGGKVNICWLSRYNEFKNFERIEDFQVGALQKNPELDNILKSVSPMFKPISIGQISFSAKSRVENHVLMAGDTAGMIHPLCGNGMAMAVISSKILSEQVALYLDGRISRKTMEREYEKKWNSNFSKRLAAGRILASVFRNDVLLNIGLKLMARFPFVLRKIISATHGKSQ